MLEMACECYDLAHTPSGSGIFRLASLYGTREADRMSDYWVASMEMPRDVQLDLGIDYKTLWDMVMMEISQELDGEGRARRLEEYAITRNSLRRYSLRQYRHLYSDAARVVRAFVAHRRAD